MSLSEHLPDSAVLAFGGNALKENGKGGNTIEAQRRAMRRAAEIIVAIRQLIEKIGVTHGNGPQVGWLMQQAELAMTQGFPPLPLSCAVAQTQASIGANMGNQIVGVDSSLRGKVSVVTTQVRVDANDPDFENPSKPIGDFMSAKVAQEMREKYGWIIQERQDGQNGKPFRRVVASPEPKEIEEIQSIQTLVNGKIITICVGGGGIPFILKGDGTMEWIDAVIDKDLASAVAAAALHFKLLAIFTAEQGIYDPDDFKRKQAGDNSVKPIPLITVADLQQMEEYLPSGSMGPKARALRRFAETGGTAWVGPLENGFEALTKGKGTTVVPD